MQSDVFSGLAGDAASAAVRRHPRGLFSVPITLRHLTGGGLLATRGITLDISEGGLGALVQGNLYLGETVAIDFLLNGCPVSAVAIVRHTSHIQTGFEFLGLTPDERQQITSAIGNA